MLRAKLSLTRSNQITEMLRVSVPLGIVAAFSMIAMTGCEKKSGEAIVLSKEHIDAALPNKETPKAQSGTPAEVEIRPMADDEIAVGAHVMKPEVRGTGRDPRALKDEQWLVEVRILDNGQTIQFPADRAQWERLHENDRVKVRYRTGKYTGTVWAAEIE